MKLTQDEVLGQRRSIRTVRRHGIVRIRDGENSCLFENACAVQAARIARSIDAFMVLVNDLRDGKGRSKLRQYIVADVAMALNESILCSGKLAGFTDDLGRNADLADVMHHGREAQDFESRSWQIHQRTDRYGELGNTILMVTSERIPVMVRAHQHCDRVPQCEQWPSVVAVRQVWRNGHDACPVEMDSYLSIGRCVQ